MENYKTALHDIDEESFRENSLFQVVTPGEVLSTNVGYLRGHGTYVANGALRSSVAGVVEKVNQLICVKALNGRYAGEVGDIVVGRISDIGNKMWKVDVQAHLEGLLMLSAVNLPEGAQRRRTYEDQLQMRTFYKEGDLISAEVQEVRLDGTLALHTRSLRYGLLENGQFVQVKPMLVKRIKQHMVTLPIGVDLVLGNNGYIWITRSMEKSQVEQGQSTKAEVLLAQRKLHADTPLTVEDRRKIAAVYNACRALDQRFAYISPDSIMSQYNQ